MPETKLERKETLSLQRLGTDWKEPPIVLICPLLPRTSQNILWKVLKRTEVERGGREAEEDPNTGSPELRTT